MGRRGWLSMGAPRLLDGIVGGRNRRWRLRQSAPHLDHFVGFDDLLRIAGALGHLHEQADEDQLEPFGHLHRVGPALREAQLRHEPAGSASTRTALEVAISSAE